MKYIYAPSQLRDALRCKLRVLFLAKNTLQNVVIDLHTNINLLLLCNYHVYGLTY